MYRQNYALIKLIQRFRLIYKKIFYSILTYLAFT